MKRLLSSVAESLTCEGPITARQATSLRELLHSRFAEPTTVQISGSEAVDGSLSRDQLLEAFAHLCSVTTRFRVAFTEISVDFFEQDNRAQARVDADIEYHLEGGTQREYRHGRFGLRWISGNLQVTSAQVLPRVIDQPEPRP